MKPVFILLPLILLIAGCSMDMFDVVQTQEAPSALSARDAEFVQRVNLYREESTDCFDDVKKRWRPWGQTEWQTLAYNSRLESTADFHNFWMYDHDCYNWRCRSEPALWKVAQARRYIPAKWVASNVGLWGAGNAALLVQTDAAQIQPDFITSPMGYEPSAVEMLGFFKQANPNRDTGESRDNKNLLSCRAKAHGLATEVVEGRTWVTHVLGTTMAEKPDERPTAENPLPTPQPEPQPPSTPPDDDVNLDLNGNCLLEDSEFFAGVDVWLSGVLSDEEFFSAMDIWIMQSDYCEATQ